MRKVVVDTDYFKFITMDCTDEILFKAVIKELHILPIMHEYVYKQELHENAFVKKLVAEDVIQIYEYSSFLTNEERKEEYGRGFRYAYKEMNGRDFSRVHQIKEYHHEKENLGEIHSAIMARMLNLDMFMSNDGGARNLVEFKLNSRKHRIQVMNIEDTFRELSANENTSLSWNQIKNVIRQFKKNNTVTDDARYERIRELWVKE